MRFFNVQIAVFFAYSNFYVYHEAGLLSMYGLRVYPVSVILFLYYHQTGMEYVTTFLLALTPIGELRAAIPYALGTGSLGIGAAYLTAVIGNMVPVFFLLWGLGWLSRGLMDNSATFKKFFDWWFSRVHGKARDKVARYGAWALVLFVAIPLPVTGAWTGSVAAFLFDIPKKKALPAIFLGVCIAGVVVTLIAQGVISGLDFFVKA